MEDPKQAKLRETAGSLTPLQLQRFIEVFPEFEGNQAHEKLRDLVAHCILYSDETLDHRDPRVRSRLEDMERLCKELLGDASKESELANWFRKLVSTTRRISHALAKFREYLAPKLPPVINIPEAEPETPFVNLVGKNILFFAPHQITVTTEEAGIIKQILPLVGAMDAFSPQFPRLLMLIKQIREIEYSAEHKYHIMFAILKIGNILHKLLPLYKTKNSVKVVEDIPPHKRECHLLTPEEQFAFIYLARDIAADFFQLMYEDKTREFIRILSLFFQGKIENTSFIAELYREGDKACTQQGALGMKRYLSDGATRNERINKLFCQTGYFLVKAKRFLNENDFNGACMAVVGAGTCGKNFNFSGFNPKRTGSIMNTLHLRRNTIAHVLEEGYNDEEMRKWLKDLTLEEYIDEIKKEAKDMGIIIDLDAYIARREQFGDDDESPRAYDFSRFTHE